jgi:DNA mismatch repair protein MutL
MPGTGRIRRLPDELIDQIKAGEVVERPASVVKELVENALDAGARRIEIEIEAGGKQLIRVRDDGEGMSRADAELALERHATSKLHSVADLAAIESRGFRGEALPAIASVSHLVLTTRTADGPVGTRVEVRHGGAPAVREAGHPRGTTVEVRDLFGSVPARRKFLRADATEAGHVAEIVTLLALPHPGCAFRLTSGGRRSLEAALAEDLGARIYQLFGDAFFEELVQVDAGTGEIAVRGFVGRPDRPGPRRPSLRLFVNDRPVRDRGLTRAVAEGYRAAGAGERRLEALLLVELPPDRVDVNVHPAKTEVRFSEARAVWLAVEQAVRDALSAGARASAPRADTSRIQQAVERYTLREGADRASEGSGRPAPAAEERWLPLGSSAAGPSRGNDAAPRGGLREERAPLAVLGQHRSTYIVASDGEDLLLIDQHTAAERVRFERLMDGLERRRVPSQRLLMPQVLELPPKLRPLFETSGEHLRQLGFDAEPFGGQSLRVSAVPEVLGNRDPGPTLIRLLEDLLERESSQWIVETERERLAATLACHSVVRAGQGLGLEAMRAVALDLAEARHPTLCPHGRPTLVRIPRAEVSRWFGRAGWRRE